MTSTGSTAAASTATAPRRCFRSDMSVPTSFSSPESPPAPQRTSRAARALGATARKSPSREVKRNLSIKRRGAIQRHGPEQANANVYQRHAPPPCVPAQRSVPRTPTAPASHEGPMTTHYGNLARTGADVKIVRALQIGAARLAVPRLAGCRRRWSFRSTPLANGRYGCTAGGSWPSGTTPSPRLGNPPGPYDGNFRFRRPATRRRSCPDPATGKIVDLAIRIVKLPVTETDVPGRGDGIPAQQAPRQETRNVRLIVPLFPLEERLQ